MDRGGFEVVLGQRLGDPSIFGLAHRKTCLFVAAILIHPHPKHLAAVTARAASNQDPASFDSARTHALVPTDTAN
jgi:hypothetical protein